MNASPAPDQFNFGKLTKEIIASRLKDAADAPAIAAEVVKRTIVAGVTATRNSATPQEAHQTVVEVARGAMLGLMLIDKDLIASAKAILGRLAEAADEIHADPQELLTWALEGIAKATPAMQRDVVYQMRTEIDRAYMGVGEIFDKLCAKAKGG